MSRARRGSDQLMQAVVRGPRPGRFSASGFRLHHDDRTANIDAAQLLRSEEHTSELQSQSNVVCRLLLEKKKDDNIFRYCDNESGPVRELHLGTVGATVRSGNDATTYSQSLRAAGRQQCHPGSCSVLLTV